MGIDYKRVVRGINAIFKSFRVISFYDEDVIKIVSELRKKFKDYIDCIIISTTIKHDKKMVTEDSDMIGAKEYLEKKFKVKIYDYKSLVKESRF